MKSMKTIIEQTDKVTFLIISQNSFVSIVRKMGDVDFQKKSTLKCFRMKSHLLSRESIQGPLAP